MKLSFEKISKSYGKTRALVDFTLELEPGIYALLGPNGAGKTTLMNIITDNLKADQGKIFFEDENTARENVLTLGVKFRERLGYMPQYPAMYGNFSINDFLWYMIFVWAFYLVQFFIFWSMYYRKEPESIEEKFLFEITSILCWSKWKS